MDCRDLEPIWADWLSGELDADRTAQLQAHLRDCPSCRQEADSLRRTLRLVKSLEGEPAAAKAVLRRRRPTMTLLRIAAAVALSFAAGFAARGLISPAAPDRVTTPPDVRAAPANWQRELALAAETRGGRLGFGQLLVALAPNGPPSDQ